MVHNTLHFNESWVRGEYRRVEIRYRLGEREVLIARTAPGSRWIKFVVESDGAVCQSGLRDSRMPDYAYRIASLLISGEHAQIARDTTWKFCKR